MDISRKLNPILDISNGLGVMSTGDTFSVKIENRNKKGVFVIPVKVDTRYTRPVARSYRFTVKIVDKIFCALSIRLLETIGILSLMLSDWIISYSSNRGYDNASMFDQKYTEADLLMMAMTIPRNTKLTYPSLKTLPAFRTVSKRHIYKIISLAKIDIDVRYKMYKEIFSA